MSQRRAAQFVELKRDWILSSLATTRKARPLEDVLRPGDAIRIGENQVPLRLNGPKDTVEEAVWRILAMEAKRLLPQRVEQLARAHGFRYTGLKMRRMKTRWGSCTAKNSINLNTWLVMLPVELSDYVILHELVHTKHKNHGPEFWSCLDAHTNGQSLKLRKALRAQRIMHFQ